MNRKLRKESASGNVALLVYVFLSLANGVNAGHRFCLAAMVVISATIVCMAIVQSDHAIRKEGIHALLQYSTKRIGN